MSKLQELNEELSERWLYFTRKENYEEFKNLSAKIRAEENK